MMAQNDRYKYAKAEKKFKSWSYSRYRDWKRCPLYAKLKHLDKLPDGDPAGSPAMARGSAIGAMAEDFVKGKLKKLPPELDLFKAQFLALQKMKMKNVWVEESWCFKRDWSHAEWNDWNNVWLRVKMDLCGIDLPTNILIPVDHKTGKYRENELGSYLEQLEIYAMGGMVKHKQVAGASPRLWFLDEGLEYPQGVGDELFYPRSDLPLLQKKWIARIQPMFDDTSFRPRPNDKCKYCNYSKARGGPCKF